MDNIDIICSVMSVLLGFILISFAVLAIGFLIGYKYEEKQILKRVKHQTDAELQESEEQKKAKRQWKNFLKYDGGAPEGRE